MPFLKATKNGKSYYSRIWHRYFEDYKWNLLTGTSTIEIKKSNNSASENHYFSDYVTLSAGVEYTVSFEYKNNSYIKGIDIFVLSDDWSTNGYIYGSSVPTSTGWTKRSFKFTLTAKDGTTSNNRMRVRINNNGTNTSGQTAELYIRKIMLQEGSTSTEWCKALSEYTIYDRPDKVGIPAYTFKVDSSHTITFGTWTLKPNEKYRVSVTFRTRGDGDSKPSKCSSVGFIAHSDDWKYSRQYIHISKQAYEERGKIVKWTYEFTVDKIVEAHCGLYFIIENAWANGYDNQTIDLYKADFKNYEIPEGNPAIYNGVASQYGYFFKDDYLETELSSLEIENNKEYLSIIPKHHRYSSDSKPKFLLKNYKSGSDAVYVVLISASFYTYSELETIKYLDLLFYTY